MNNLHAGLRGLKPSKELCRLCQPRAEIHEGVDKETNVGSTTAADNQAKTAAGDFTQATEPFGLFDAWFTEAQAGELNDPNAMALATSDASGLPNVRMVLMNGPDKADAPNRGFVFYTNLGSAKGQELAGNPQAAILFHWKSLRRQVRARGIIAPVSSAEADAYFDQRPRLSRIGAWASDQSRALDSRATFEDAIAAYSETYKDGAIPRPPHWSGFRLTPLEIEFWHDRPFRLHDRVVFRRVNAANAWTKERLYP
jgi:pyridoxamine 5'-phosphate oxidase